MCGCVLGDGGGAGRGSRLRRGGVITGGGWVAAVWLNVTTTTAALQRSAVQTIELSTIYRENFHNILKKTILGTGSLLDLPVLAY